MELKPCPFCGAPGKVQTKRTVKRGYPTVQYRIIDSNIECAVFPATNWKDTKEEAKEAWNRRGGQ